MNPLPIHSPASPVTPPLPQPTGFPAVGQQEQPLGRDLGRSAFDVVRERRDLEATARAEAEAAAQAEAALPTILEPGMAEQLASASRSTEHLGGVFVHLKNAQDIQARIDTAIAKGLPADHPSVHRATQLIHGELLAAQCQAQTAGLSLEAASKVIESGTSGVRTVLQTQA